MKDLFYDGTLILPGEKTGQKIKAARLRAGLTQTELGKRIGVSQSMIGQYETSHRIPKINALNKIADATGVSFIALLGTDYGTPIPFGGPISKELNENYDTDMDSHILELFHSLNSDDQKSALSYMTFLYHSHS